MKTVIESPLKPGKKFRLPTAVLGGDISESGQKLYCGCMDGLYELDLAKGEEKKLDSHESYVSSVSCISDNQVVSAGYDGAIQWFDIAGNKRTRRTRTHQFWSWQMKLSPDKKRIASVTGQYLAGDYEYNPAPESEPSIKILDIESGKEVGAFSHRPSVQAVAFSPDSRFVAAGNLMGEVRVYEIESGKKVAQWTTKDFTSWGIIKSHCNIGGIYDLQFSPDGNAIYVAGMGYMRDPMAGNGKQLWQKFAWREKTPAKLDETHKGESGEGLMETLAIHPGNKHFIMAGRLRGGSWNVALFEIESGKLVQSLKTGCRITHATFDTTGKRLFLLGGQGQPRNKDGKFPKFGRVDTFDVELG